MTWNLSCVFEMCSIILIRNIYSNGNCGIFFFICIFFLKDMTLECAV